MRPKALARAGDSATSHEAADTVEKSGTAQRQRDVVLRAVRNTPGLSSRELGSYCHVNPALLDRYIFARRLPELRDAGLVGHRYVAKVGDTVFTGDVECVKFNTAIHDTRPDGGAAWWPVKKRK
jgi:hypothetical protein